MAEILLVTSKVTVLVFLITSMSAIGLGLTVRQIVVPLRSVKFVAMALLANFGLAPLLAMGISKLLRLDAPFAQGLLLLGLAAGAPFMPKISRLAKCDPARSAGLMVLLMASTTLILPVALPVLVKGVQVDSWKIARFLILLMLLPLAGGLAARARTPALAARLGPVLEKISSAALLTMLVLIVALHFRSVLSFFGTGAILAAILFAVLSAGAGRILAGRDRTVGLVLGFGTGLRNVPAALVVAVQNFADPAVQVMVIVTTLAGIMVLAPAARRIGRRGSDPGPGDAVISQSRNLTNQTHCP